VAKCCTDRVKWFLPLLVFVLSSLAFTQATDLSGMWLAQGLDRTVTLQLEVTGEVVTGTLEGVQEVMTVTGKLRGNIAEGTVTNSLGSAYFKFDFTSEQLVMTLANFDAQGKPDTSSAAVFTLKRPEGPKVEVGFQVAGFAAPQSDPLLGAWVLNSLRLELRTGAAKGKYTGRIFIGNQKANITASGSASSLKGSFKLGKVTKSFTSKLGRDDRLTLVLDGKTYVLSRVR
jgi:hypothetical protein